MIRISKLTKQKLLSYPNVVGVGYGFKVVAGKTTSTKAIIVFVNKKIPVEGLEPDSVIPKSIDGHPTDIRLLKVRALAEDPAFYRPSPGGCSVGHYQITAGTLGTWVKYKDQFCVLSNNHVLANSNAGAIGDRILQPGPYDKGQFPIASLLEFKQINFEGSAPPTDCDFAQILEFLLNLLSGLFGRSTKARFVKPNAEPNYVDAALAKANDVAVVSPEILEIGKLDPITITPELGMIVQKRGRTTRLTTGFISIVDAQIQVQYENAIAIFEDQVVVETNDNSDFSAGGDSGSLVVNNNRPVGLLFAGGEDESGKKVTIINNIDRIVEAFPGIEFV